MNRFAVTTSLAFALSCGAALAQAADPQQAPAPPQDVAGMHHHHRPNPHKQAEMISRRLNLTQDQSARLELILAGRDQQMEALHSNAQLSPQDLHAQMRSINQQTEQQLATVLNPDQLAQLKEMRRHHMHHDQPGEASTPSPNV